MARLRPTGIKTMDILSKLNKALKGSPDSGSGTGSRLIHENESEIIEAAKGLLAKSQVGADLLQFAQSSGIKMHVLKNKQDFGVFPTESTVYISCPAGMRMPPARAAIHLAGALREAQQDQLPEFKRPDYRLGRAAYKAQGLARKSDELDVQVRLVYDLAEVNGLLEIVDEFAAMGYLEVYEAYKAELNG